MIKEKLSFDELPDRVHQLLKKVENIERLLENRDAAAAPQSDKLLSVKEAAEFLNLSVPTIYSKVSRNELPVMKRSKRLYFSRVELTEYLRKGRRKTLSEIEDEAEEYLINKKGLNNG